MAGRPSISFFINECGRLPYSSANIRNSLEKHNNNPDYYTFRHIKQPDHYTFRHMTMAKTYTFCLQNGNLGLFGIFNSYTLLFHFLSLFRKK